MAACKWLITIKSPRFGWILIIAVRCPLSVPSSGGGKDGWIYRFFPCTGSGLAGRPSCENRPTCRSQGSSRRSGRFPALPYPPLKQIGLLEPLVEVSSKGVFPVSVSLGV